MAVNVLIKPAGPDCNLDCTYCFYLEKDSLFPESRVHRMRENVLEEMVRQVMEHSIPAASFAWQGGEPTLCGLPFFEKAVEFQKKYGIAGQSVSNALQTNGLLIDEKWAAFFAKYHFLLGVSMDGPPEMHDRYRVTKAQARASHHLVRDALDRLRQHHAEFNILVVLNPVNVKHPREVYHYFVDQGFTYLQFIPLVEVNPETGELLPFSIQPEEYGRFLCEVFDEWMKEPVHNRAYIRIFNDTFAVHMGLPSPTCVFMKTCGKYVVVEHNGNVYSCDFYVDPSWHLGNLMQTPLHALLAGEKQKHFGRDKNRLPSECHQCEYLHFCWGGCPKNRIHTNPHGNGNPSNYFCQSYKMYFAHTHKTFQRIREAQLARENRHATRTHAAPSASHAQGKVGRNTSCPCGSGRKYKHCCARSLR